MRSCRGLQRGGFRFLNDCRFRSLSDRFCVALRWIRMARRLDKLISEPKQHGTSCATRTSHAVSHCEITQTCRTMVDGQRQRLSIVAAWRTSQAGARLPGIHGRPAGKIGRHFTLPTYRPFAVDSDGCDVTLPMTINRWMDSYGRAK